jgi:thiol-disulfide isomerase/thioredoxin
MQTNQRLPILVLVSLLALGGGSSLAGEQAAGAPQTVEEAQALAAERNVPVLVDLFATWCGPCKVFDRDSNEDAEIQAALGKVVLIKIDGEKGDGIAIAASYQLGGWPTYVLLNEDGKTIRQWVGYEKQHFLKNITTGVADQTTIEARMQRFEKAPSSEDALTLATYHAAREETQKSFQFYEKAADLNEDPAVDYSGEIFMVAYDGYRNGEVTVQQMVKAGDRVLAWKDHSTADAIHVARYMTAVGRKEKDPDMMVPFLQAAISESENVSDETITKMRKSLMIDYKLFVDKDVDGAIELRKARLPEGWQQNTNALNSFAWWCFENNVNLEEAETLARNGAELAESGESKAMILDTLAEICNLRGSCKDAVLYIELAIENDPDRQYYKEQLARFQKELAAKGE